MLSFSLVADALTGLINHRPSDENFNFQFFLSVLTELRNSIVLRSSFLLVFPCPQEYINLNHALGGGGVTVSPLAPAV